MRVHFPIQRIARAAGDLLSIALPRHCPGCEAVMDVGHRLCDSCQERFDALCRVPCCARCASPIPDPLGPCGRCKDKGLAPIENIARLTTFESITRDLIHGMKYGRRWPLADWIAGELLRTGNVLKCVQSSDVVVPVPLYWTKRLSRGFNQAELLARELARRADLRVVAALRRVVSTRSQTAFHSRAARQQNMQNAFRLTRPDLLKGRRILLVDDVMTSGATLQAAARVIRDGCKPAAIKAVVIASANPLATDLAP